MSGKRFRPTPNPALLAWARRSANLSTRELASYCKVTEEEVTLWEAGADFPSLRQLRRFADRCKRPLAAFYLPAPPKEKAPPKDYRSIAGSQEGVFSPDTILAIRTAQRVQSIASRLAQEMGENWHPRLPALDYHRPVDEQAAAYRQELGFTLEQQIALNHAGHAYNKWRSLLERNRIMTLQATMPLADARGFSLADELVPVVLANTRDTTAARCFTILHEVAHLALREPGVCVFGEEATGRRAGSHRVERFCNEFAATTLFPISHNSSRNRRRSMPGPTITHSTQYR